MTALTAEEEHPILRYTHVSTQHSHQLWLQLNECTLSEHIEPGPESQLDVSRDTVPHLADCVFVSDLPRAWHGARGRHTTFWKSVQELEVLAACDGSSAWAPGRGNAIPASDGAISSTVQSQVQGST